MILATSLEHRLSAPCRVLWIAACLAILPWAASGALGQKTEEAPVKDPPPVPVEAKTGDSKPHDETGKDFEHRLSRMEEQLAELMAEIRSLRGKSPGKEKVKEKPALKIGDGAIESLDPDSGKLRWKTELKGPPHVEVYQKGDRVVVTDPKRRKTVILDSETGKVISKSDDVEKEVSSSDDKDLDAVTAKLRAENKRLSDEQHRKAEDAAREAKEASQREYKEALRVKTDIAKLEGERAKLLGELKKLEEKCSAIKDQLKKLESQSPFEHRIK